MNILMLTDKLDNWAIHNRAKAFQKFMPEHSFVIRAGLNNPSCLADQQNFDLIHFNFSYGLTQYANFILDNKHRCVITVVNERSLLVGFGVAQGIFEKILKACPHVTSVNKKMADMVGAKYIPNGIDEDKFDVWKNPVVGYSGTNRDNKNVGVIIAACRDLGVELRTAFYNDMNPTMPHERMKEFYMSIDVYVHASITEGFNNTIIEALSCNVPVLMTRQGCWHEFEGWVDFIDPTVDSVKKGLQKFLGRRLICEKFLWKNIFPKYRQVYAEAFKCTRI